MNEVRIRIKLQEVLSRVVRLRYETATDWGEHEIHDHAQLVAQLRNGVPIITWNRTQQPIAEGEVESSVDIEANSPEGALNVALLNISDWADQLLTKLQQNNTAKAEK